MQNGVPDFSVVCVLPSLNKTPTNWGKKGRETKTTNSGKTAVVEVSVSVWNILVFGSHLLGFFCQTKAAKDFAAGNNVIINILSGALTYSLGKTTQVWTKERRTRCWQCPKTYILTPLKLVWNKTPYLYMYSVYHTQRQTRANLKHRVKTDMYDSKKIKCKTDMWILNPLQLKWRISTLPFSARGSIQAPAGMMGCNVRAPAITPIWACARLLPVSLWPLPMRTGCAQPHKRFHVFNMSTTGAVSYVLLQRVYSSTYRLSTH